MGALIPQTAALTPRRGRTAKRRAAQLLRCIEQGLRQGLVDADGRTHLVAIVFIHHFGALLNAHLHFHVIVIDGVFCGEDAETLRFEEVRLSPQAVQRLHATIRKRIVRLFVRRGLLDKGDGEALCASARPAAVGGSATGRPGRRDPFVQPKPEFEVDQCIAW